MTRRCDGNIGARQAKVSRHIFPEEAARISIGPARRRDLNRIHWRRASEWQHKRAANLPNLLHQRGTRGLLLNSGHQRNWSKKKKKKERKRKREKRRRDEGKEEEVIFIAMKNLLRFPSPGFHARREGSFLNRATFCLSFEFDERGNDYEGRNWALRMKRKGLVFLQE